MRIAYITTGFSPDENDGFGSNSIHYFIKEISFRESAEAVVFSLYYPLKKENYKFHRATVYSYGEKLNSGKFLKFISWSRLRRKFIEEHKKKPFNLIHSFWCGESGYTAVHLGEKFKIPVIASVCGGEVADIPEIDYGSQRRFFQRYFVNKTFEKATVINSLSRYVSKIISDRFDSKCSSKVITQPFGVDENIFKPLNFRKESDEIKLISITNAVPVKAHNVLLKAFRKAWNENRKLKLEIHGLNCPERLGGLAEELGLSSSVKLFPFINHNQIPILMNNSDIYVLSSLYEAQNISLVEAAFCGLPVISTNVGCAEDVSCNLVRSGDSDSLAEAIIKVAGNLQEEKLKALNKRKELLEKYSLKNTTDRFIEVYKKMI
ncbi:MAG: glycosyltransferase family 4 protein [Ignavibacteria bacterium]|nr:glycosyltransferase family 4 protein [Ignavibacteria bacterium]